MNASIGRTVTLAVLAFAGIMAILLLVRPFIFSLAPPRDDSAVAVAAVGELTGAPTLRPVLLNGPHGLLGERVGDGHAEVSVVASRTVTGQYAVVNAWSPVNDCAVTLGADRVTDCQGVQWTLAGDPFAPGDPPLQRFPVTIANGALVVDFTQPVDEGR